MQHDNDMIMTQGRELYRLVGFTAVDRDGDRIGTVEEVWEDSSNQPAFLAIKTGWLGLGRTHIVPAQNAEVNETKQDIRLPYDQETLKQAPHFESVSDFDTETERQIYEYYGGHGFTGYQGYEGDWSGTGRAALETEPQASQAREGESIELKEEELKVGKRKIESGGVRLRKVIRTETVNQPVELQREEIEIERIPVGRGKPADSSFQEEDIYIPLRREEAVISKDAKVTEEVRARKLTETGQERISETLRKEELEVEREGGEKPL